MDGSLSLGTGNGPFVTIQEGQVEGQLIGGNLQLTHGLVCGKYKIDFQDKILFIEDLGIESPPEMISNFLYFMKQNDVFDKIKGLWIGNYEHESEITLEKMVSDVLELPNKKYTFPIVKSNHFGHIEMKTVIPIGTKAKIDTSISNKVQLIENCVK